MQQLVDKPQLVHDPQGARMHGVAAEIAQKISVLFQDNNPDPGAGKQKSVNHAGGTTTGNTNPGLQNLCHGPTLLRGMAGSVGQLSSLDRVHTRPHGRVNDVVKHHT